MYYNKLHEPSDTTMAVVDAALAVFMLSPPGGLFANMLTVFPACPTNSCLSFTLTHAGAETQCLDALRHATAPRRLARLLPHLLTFTHIFHTCFHTCLHTQVQKRSA
mgnify:CR=1 FL=1